MATKNILHMFSPLKHMSPFDVNMALDAGFDSVTPYTGVMLDDITPLVQDAMFSRSPRDAVRTGVFIAGKDAGLALDMMERLRAALLKPFEISAFADPAGSFTTAAAMVACVEKLLKEKKGRSLANTKILIFGATGVVGYASGVIAALEGAEVTLAGYDGVTRVQAKADDIKKRFGVDVRAIDASTEEKKLAALGSAEVAFCAAAAGKQVLSAAALASAKSLLVAADVNAVPPAGVEGLELMDNGVELPSGALGVGPLAIGDVKYKTEVRLVPAHGDVIYRPQPRFSRCLRSRTRDCLNPAPRFSSRRRQGALWPPPRGAPDTGRSSPISSTTRTPASWPRPIIPSQAVSNPDSRAESLIAALETLAEARAPVGLVYGAGFEDRAELLQDLALRWTVFGNRPEVVRRVKDPLALAALCAGLDISHPQISVTMPQDADNWLVKSVGGSGGSHVAPALTWRALDEKTYFQRIAPGDPVSILFLANGVNAHVLGASRQWPTPAPDEPFRFGGSLRPADLSRRMEQRLTELVEAMSRACGLVGLNSIDLLVDGGDFTLIEINPRPGATLDIFEDRDGLLFQAHLDACLGRLPVRPLEFDGAAAAGIAYARRAIPSMPALDWPDWALDRQKPQTALRSHEPLCTVRARAAEPSRARVLMDERTAFILDKIEHLGTGATS